MSARLRGGARGLGRFGRSDLHGHGGRRSRARAGRPGPPPRGGARHGSGRRRGERRAARPAPAVGTVGGTGVGLARVWVCTGATSRVIAAEGVRQRYGGGRAAVRPVLDERNRGGSAARAGGSAALRGLRHRNPVWSTTHRRHEGRAVTFCVRSVTAALLRRTSALRRALNRVERPCVNRVAPAWDWHVRQGRARPARPPGTGLRAPSAPCRAAPGRTAGAPTARSARRPAGLGSPRWAAGGEGALDVADAAVDGAAGGP